jgi:hypothetical protein
MKMGALLIFLFYFLPLNALAACSESMTETIAELGKEYKEMSSHKSDWNIVSWTFDKAHTIITFSWADGSEECQKTTENISAPEGSYYNEPDGFRGIKWGTRLTSLQGMKFIITSDDNIKLYSKKTDQLTIGSAKLLSIVYGFWRDKLYSAQIRFKGYHNWEVIKGSLFEKFGYGSSLPDGQSFGWKGNKTHIVVSWNDISNEGVLAMYSNELLAKKAAVLQDEIKAGANKGF